METIINPVGPDVAIKGQWLDATGNYFEGDKQPDSVAVPKRPSIAHKLVAGAWALDPKLDAGAKIAALEAEQGAALTARALREVLLAITPNGVPPPVLADLRAIDNQITVERAKL